MKNFHSDENLVLEGKKVKLLCTERSVKADAGVVVDYFRCTMKREKLFDANIPSGHGLTVDPLQLDSEIVADVAKYFAGNLGFKLGEARNGRDYYDHTFTIVNENGEEVASVSGGGEHQRRTFCFSLKGNGCTFAANGWERRLYDLLEPMQAKITRLDLARDFFQGEHSYTEAIQAFQAGEFSYRGREPSMMCVGDILHGHSTTFQVGKRESGKVFRGYDKGHQFKLMDDKWWRAEVELRSNNRVVPLEALIRPAAFFAGAYAFTAKILEEVAPQSIPTATKISEASVERTVQWFKRTVAPSLVHLSQACGFDWLMDIAIHEAYRPLPKSLAGLSPQSMQAAMQKSLKQFSQAPSAPAIASALICG